MRAMDSDVTRLDASVTVPGGSTMAAVRAIIDREIVPHMAHINTEVATVMQAAGGYQFRTTHDVTVHGAQEGTKDATSCLVSHQSRWYIVLVPQQQQLPQLLQQQQQITQQQQQQQQQQQLQGQVADTRMYCNAGHAMEETSCMDGAYAQGGWWCDLCGGGCGVGFGKRWCCKLCTVDYCFSCRKSANEATGDDAASGGGGGVGAGSGGSGGDGNPQSASFDVVPSASPFRSAVWSPPRQRPVYGIASYSSIIHRGRTHKRAPLLDARRCLEGN